MSAALFQPIQNDFDKSFRKVFTRALPVRWPRLEKLTRTITTRHVFPESMVMPRGFQEHTRVMQEHLGKIPLTEQQEK